MLQAKDLKMEEPKVVDPNARVERPTKDQIEKRELHALEYQHFSTKYASAALVVFKLLTRKKNQIRAMCSYLHAPIIGDVTHSGISVRFICGKLINFINQL